MDPQIEQLKTTFEMLPDWEERYRFIIDLGRKLEPLADEERTEASAMAEHLVRHLAVPADAIDLEQSSTSTVENLELSRPYVAAPGRAPLVVVTSEYHAYRTAGLLARTGIEGVVVGAWTRRSYLPGAMVREALAVVSDRRWWCAGAAIVLWGLAAWGLSQPA